LGRNQDHNCLTSSYLATTSHPASNHRPEKHLTPQADFFHDAARAAQELAALGAGYLF
jgi:hypothetical protein